LRVQRITPVARVSPYRLDTAGHSRPMQCRNVANAHR
jgi:hypothetical protein